jgi:hypothetical protein
METVINFLNEYGILSMVITAVVGAVGTGLGLFVKWLYNRTIGDKVKEETKEKVAAVVVKYVEQVWKDLHGEEKLEKALEAFSEMLAEKGITISDLEMRVYLEAALAGFNNAFTKSADTTEVTFSESEVE